MFFAIYRIEKPLVALRYMELSLKSDLENNAPLSHTASTKLNICAILSTLERHSEALVFASEAVKHLFDTIADIHDPLKTNQYVNVDQSILYNTLTVALFNLGVENEHLKDFE